MKSLIAIVLLIMSNQSFSIDSEPSEASYACFSTAIHLVGQLDHNPRIATTEGEKQYLRRALEIAKQDFEGLGHTVIYTAKRFALYGRDISPYKTAEIRVCNFEYQSGIGEGEICREYLFYHGDEGQPTIYAIVNRHRPSWAVECRV